MLVVIFIVGLMNGAGKMINYIKNLFLTYGKSEKGIVTFYKGASCGRIGDNPTEILFMDFAPKPYKGKQLDRVGMECDCKRKWFGFEPDFKYRKRLLNRIRKHDE